MPTIKFSDTGEIYEVKEGTSVLDCALDHNYPLEHDCGGNCACTTCCIEVEQGSENFTPMSEDERGLLEANDRLNSKNRLGCQSKILKGTVVVKAYGA